MCLLTKHVSRTEKYFWHDQKKVAWRQRLVFANAQHSAQVWIVLVQLWLLQSRVSTRDLPTAAIGLLLTQSTLLSSSRLSKGYWSSRSSEAGRERSQSRRRRWRRLTKPISRLALQKCLHRCCCRGEKRKKSGFVYYIFAKTKKSGRQATGGWMWLGS